MSFRSRIQRNNSLPSINTQCLDASLLCLPWPLFLFPYQNIFCALPEASTHWACPGWTGGRFSRLHVLSPSGAGWKEASVGTLGFWCFIYAMFGVSVLPYLLKRSNTIGMTVLQKPIKVKIWVAQNHRHVRYSLDTADDQVSPTGACHDAPALSQDKVIAISTKQLFWVQHASTHG